MKTVTSIPIEYLFGFIAALIAIIYGDLKREVRQNTKAGNRRDTLLSRICEKLKIPFDPQ